MHVSHESVEQTAQGLLQVIARGVEASAATALTGASKK